MRQYIGARYVPQFYQGEHGMEWDGPDVPYDALVIVTYLNNTYTSKKSVPVNVDITNEEYWVMTGAYNAQVADLASRVVDVEAELANVDVFVTPQKYGAVGDGVTDDTAAVRAALAVGGLIVFPKGTYLISETLRPVSGSMLLGCGANNSIIKAADNFNNNIIEYTGTTSGITIENLGVVFGTSNDGNCIVLGDGIEDNSVGRGTFIHNIVLKNAPKSGLLVKNYYWTIVVDGVYAEKCGDAGIEVAGSDNLYSNINVFDCRYGLYVHGSNNKFVNIKTYVIGDHYHQVDPSHLYTAGVYVESCVRNDFTNVEAQDCLSYGFHVYQSSEISFKNCQCDANANINTFIAEYDVANALFEGCSNMSVEMSFDDRTGHRCQHPFKMKNCNGVIVKGTVTSANGLPILETNTMCEVATHVIELLEKRITRGDSVKSVTGITAENGSYSGNVYRPTTTDINTSNLKISLADADEETAVKIAAVVDLADWTYYRMRLYVNGTLKQDESQAAISEGQRYISRSYTLDAGSTDNYVMLAFQKIQDYTFKGISCLTNVDNLTDTSSDQLVDAMCYVADQK